jgi:hypothetical protein
MAKKLVSKDKLEALLLARVKTKPGGEKPASLHGVAT